MQKKTKINEANYIVGMDLGQRVTMISYLDQKTLKPIPYDLSGGYGETAVPLILQYLIAEKDFLIGGDAKLNEFQEGTVTLYLMEILCSGTNVSMDEMLFSPSDLFAIFIGKIIDSFKQLNPNALVESMTIAIEDHLFSQLKDVITEGMRRYKAIKLKIVSATEATLHYLVMNQVPIEEQSYRLDYGYAAVTRYVLVKNENQVVVQIEDIDTEVSLKKIEAAIREEIMTLYKAHTNCSTLSENEMSNLEQLLDICFMSIFQKLAKQQGIKLYYNFAFPPFQKVLSYKRINELLEPFVQAFKMNLSRFENKELPVMMVGQGFKMMWPVELINQIHRSIEANPFESISKGCCLIAASAYISLQELQVSFKEKDVQKYEIMLGEGNQELLLPITEGELILIVDFEAEETLRLCLVTRDAQKNRVIEAQMQLEKINALDNRVRICTKLDLSQDQKPDLNIEYLPM